MLQAVTMLGCEGGVVCVDVGRCSCVCRCVCLFCAPYRAPKVLILLAKQSEDVFAVSRVVQTWF